MMPLNEMLDIVRDLHTNSKEWEGFCQAVAIHLNAAHFKAAVLQPGERVRLATLSNDDRQVVYDYRAEVNGRPLEPGATGTVNAVAIGAIEVAIDGLVIEGNKRDNTLWLSPKSLKPLSGKQAKAA